MQSNKLFRNLFLLCIAVALIVAGYLLGVRNRIDSSHNEITTISPNNAIENSLSQIQTRDVTGAINPGSVNIFGQFYYKIVDNRTEILIKLNNVPEEVKTDSQSKKIPDKLKISTADRGLDGLNYEYQEIGVISFDEPKNGVRSASFTTVIEPNEFGRPLISSIERIVFEPINDEEANIFKDSSPDLPQNVRDNPAPYFWIVL